MTHHDDSETDARPARAAPRPHGPHADGRSRWPRWLQRRGRAAKTERAARSYRRLAMQLRFDLGEGAAGRCVLLTTADANRHGARAALELAHLLAAEQRQRVLVVDGCLGDGVGLTAELAAEGHRGLGDLLADDAEERDIASAIVATAVPELTFLPKGASRQAPMGLLTAERLGRLLRQLRTTHDWVLVHGPAVLEDPVALAYPSQVDAVLLLVVENKTLLADIDASQRALAEAKASRVGLVLSAPRRAWS